MPSFTDSQLDDIAKGVKERRGWNLNTQFPVWGMFLSAVAAGMWYLGTAEDRAVERAETRAAIVQLGKSTKALNSEVSDLGRKIEQRTAGESEILRKLTRMNSDVAEQGRRLEKVELYLSNGGTYLPSTPRPRHD